MQKESFKYFLKNPNKFKLAIMQKQPIGYLFPDKALVKCLYKDYEGRKINLRNPKDLNEKLQWLKLYDHNPLYTKLVDKYEVRSYIQNAIGKKYLMDCYGIWDSFDEIDFATLPDKFILKCTHTSGGNVICNNKNEFNYREAKDKIDKYLKNDYYLCGREWPYKHVPHRVMAEELIENKDKSPLIDYKFYCYGGEPRYFMYSVGEYSHNVRNLKYDLKGNCIDYLFKEHPALESDKINLPRNLDEMVSVSRELCLGLCKDAQHVRIDLYNIDGRIVFGEITFYSGSGFIHIKSKSFSEKMASYIDLSKVKKR